MCRDKKYTVYCRFSAIGKKTIFASSLKKAIKIAESEDSIDPDEIIRITDRCKFDESLINKFTPVYRHHKHIEYKSLGSE